MARTPLLSVVGLLGLVGCGAGRFPEALSRRPLGMPQGEHQVVLAGGAQKGSGRVGVATDVGYRYGITDNLGIQLPLVFSYGGPVADNLELRGRAGLVGFGGGARQRAKDYPRDPRIFPETGSEGFYGLWQGGLVARSTVGQEAALVGAFDVSAFVGGRGVYRPSLGGAVAYVFDVGPWVSASLGVAAGLSGESPAGVEDQQHAIFALGSVLSGIDHFPLLSVHLAPELDVVGIAGWSYNPTSSIGGFHAEAGLDWHFD